MSEWEQKLNLLLKIRNLRAKRQMTILQASEFALKSKLQEQAELTKNMEVARETYLNQQREQTKKLLASQSQIHDFLVLKDDERVFFWKNKNMTRQGDALAEQIQQSEVAFKDNQRKFKVLEKAVIKVEEFLKLDWK